jgi:hypothetical protein
MHGILFGIPSIAAKEAMLKVLQVKNSTTMINIKYREGLY